MTSPQQEWHPEWSVSPGEILAEELEARGVSQSELARRMGRPIKTINEIVNTKAALTAETAMQLELALGVSAKLWVRLEADYRAQLARTKSVHALATQRPWAKSFPLTDLKRYGLIDIDQPVPGKNKQEAGTLVASLLRFFGVSSVDAWTRAWADPVGQYRHSPTFTSEPQALAAWLRWGEVVAEHFPTEPFDAGKLTAVLIEARGMTREEPLDDVLDELRDRLANCGVVLALTPGLDGTRVSGVARWLSPARALIQLSMRYRADDHLWFTFFHEAVHLLDDVRSDRLDGEDDPLDASNEIEARTNQRARDLLIDPDALAGFVKAGALDEHSVRAFADDIGIAPGIVVGRLQHDGVLGPRKLNHVKRPVEWI
jgi:HTH-type transcriptional regulator/antitoxin HigA